MELTTLIERTQQIREALRVADDAVEDAPSLVDFALAVCIWAVFPAALVLGVWVVVG